MTMDAAAACANHAAAPAVATCKRCGLFLCDACLVLEGDESYCPACSERRSRPASLRAKFAVFMGLAVLPLAATIGLSHTPLALGCFLAIPVWATAAGLSLAERRRIKQDPEDLKSRKWLVASLAVSAAGLLALVPVLYVFAIAFSRRS